MIEWQLMLTGLAIGIAVAAPIGPINIMCIQRSLKQGFWAGLLTGMGAVLGDGTYAAIAAFSITSISEFLIGFRSWIEVIGGLFLIALGLRIAFSEAMPEPVENGQKAVRHAALLGTTYFMTITNPATMLGFVAIFGGIGGLVSRPGDYLGAAVMVAAVMTGSFLWWVFLSGMMHRFRRLVGAHILTAINRVSGCVIALFGAAVLMRLIIELFGRS